MQLQLLAIRAKYNHSCCRHCNYFLFCRVNLCICSFCPRRCLLKLVLASKSTAKVYISKCSVPKGYNTTIYPSREKTFERAWIEPGPFARIATVLTTTIHGLINPNAISIKPVYAPDITAKAKPLFQSALPPKSPECLVLMKEELVIAGTKSNFEATSPNHFTASVASINTLETVDCGKARLTCD